MNKTANIIGDRELEALWSLTASDIPVPEHITKNTVPWRSAIRKILVGMLLQHITLDFWNLNLFLPFWGTIFLLLGSRSLRKENSWFLVHYAISGVQMLLLYIRYIAQATIWMDRLMESPFFDSIVYIEVIFFFLQAFLLWGGIQHTRKRNHFPCSYRSLALIAGFYGIITVLGVLNYHGWLAYLLAAGYLGCLYSLYVLAGELAEAGYSIQAAPIKIGNPMVITVFTVLMLAGLSVGWRWGNCYYLNWQEITPMESSASEKNKEHLISLGMPERIASDLTEEELKELSGATRILVEQEDYPMNNGKTSSSISFITAALQMDEEGIQWKFIHYFFWNGKPDNYQTEAMTVIPIYSGYDFWEKSGDFSGRVLYSQQSHSKLTETPLQNHNQKNASLWADYYTFEENQAAMDFWGEAGQQLIVEFSFPRGGENYRGYVLYGADKPEQEGYTTRMISTINYAHQEFVPRIPTKTAMEVLKESLFADEKGFRIVNLMPDLDSDTPEKK